jgi:hypothetical protein
LIALISDNMGILIWWELSIVTSERYSFLYLFSLRCCHTFLSIYNLAKWFFSLFHQHNIVIYHTWHSGIQYPLESRTVGFVEIILLFFQVCLKVWWWSSGHYWLKNFQDSYFLKAHKVSTRAVGNTATLDYS